MSERPDSTPRVSAPRASKIAVSVLGHLTATTVFFAAFAMMFVNEQIMGLVGVGLQDTQLRADVVTPIVLVFGLSACAWALTFIVYSLVRLRLPKSRGLALSRARGTIITETLVVLPIFFLLTFGLAQMAVNSMAGLLSTLASYEVARTLAVWAPESRANVDANVIREKARLVGAAVVAPIVPENRAGLAGCDQNATSLRQMREGLQGVGLESGVGGETRTWSMKDAFGTRAFSERGPTKLTLAFCNSWVTWTPVDRDTDNVNIQAFTATFTYHHPAVFPMVGPIFAQNPGAGNWGTNYVSSFTKSYSMTTYLTPNIWAPYADPVWLFNAGGIQ